MGHSSCARADAFSSFVYHESYLRAGWLVENGNLEALPEGQFTMFSFTLRKLMGVVC
ncbi:MAG: hypothetical protein WCF18_24385 [Chthoniobacteraceae bacterium]